jgi:aminopeptidase N
MLYLKAPLFLRYLHHITGAETFDKIIHAYFEKWKFKHVDEEAFLSVCEEVSGMDLGELFQQWLKERMKGTKPAYILNVKAN